jgi:hypothetical protein
MNVKKISSLVVVVLGVGMLWGSYYINAQVASGQMQVDSAERKINQSKSLFSLNPVAKEIGEGMTKSADRKINEAKDEISYYSNVARNLQIGGIVALIVGVLGFVFLGRSKKT